VDKVPRFPTVDPLTGSQGGFRAPGVAPVRDATGAQISALGQAVEGTGRALATAGSQIQADVDNGRVDNRYNIWSTANQQDLATYLNTVGEGALGDNRQAVLEKIQARGRTLEASLDNETQRGMFKMRLDRQMEQVKGQVLSHEANQAQSFRVAEARTMVDVATGDAIEAKALGSDDDFRFHQAVAIRRAGEVADALGFGDARREEFIRGAHTAIHAGVVQRLLDDDQLSEAADYLEGVDANELMPGMSSVTRSLPRRFGISP
jgi:LPS O-antigen subunit length determinant protein (WzzB/FepE family)